MQLKENNQIDLALEKGVFGFVLSGMILFVSYTVIHDLVAGSKQIVFLGDVFVLCVLVLLWQSVFQVHFRYARF